jgi:hypothetical protein
MNEMATLVELHAREAEYWYEIDHNAGRSAHLHYAEDGTFAIGDKVFSGHEEIAGFYRWRAELGARTARHVVTNPRIRADRNKRDVLQHYAAVRGQRRSGTGVAGRGHDRGC